MVKKICMLLHEPYPNDIRVSKEASALLKAGYEIHLICLRKKGQPATEEVNGIQVHRLAMARSFFWRGIWDVLLAINFFQSRFYKKLSQLHQEHNFDVIHVHDLPLSKTAIRFRDSGKKVKVVLDYHENYPEALRVWFAWKKNPVIRWKNRTFFGYDRWLRYEKQVSQQADLIIVVVDEMKSRVSELHNVPASRIVTVTNSEPRTFLDQQSIPDIYGGEANDFVLAYTGGVGPHRGVDTAVKSLAFLKDYPAIRLEITGTLTDSSRAWLEGLAREEGVSDKVVINGYQPFEKFFSYMKFAAVNLIPHNRNGHTDNTIPHKLFQGMLTGNPVLVSSAPPLKRIVESYNCGLVFEGGNAKDFAEKVKALYSDQALYKELGQNGYRATYEGTENWEHTGHILSDVYQNLLNADT